MKPGFGIGATHRMEYVVPPNKLVRDLHPELAEFAQGQPVLATGYMVGLMEAPCMAALRPYLSEGEDTVGVWVSMAHASPVIPGMTLVVEAALVGVRDRVYEFSVAVTDAHDRPVAAGTIEQAVILTERFQRRIRRLREDGCVTAAAGMSRDHLPHPASSI